MTTESTIGTGETPLRPAGTNRTQTVNTVPGDTSDDSVIELPKRRREPETTMEAEPTPVESPAPQTETLDESLKRHTRPEQREVHQATSTSTHQTGEIKSDTPFSHRKVAVLINFAIGMLISWALCLWIVGPLITDKLGNGFWDNVARWSWYIAVFSIVTGFFCWLVQWRRRKTHYYTPVATDTPSVAYTTATS